MIKVNCIVVFANDLMHAIDNCRNGGGHRWPAKYRRVGDED